jgi:hypothetical protein
VTVEQQALCSSVILEAPSSDPPTHGAMISHISMEGNPRPTPSEASTTVSFSCIYFETVVRQRSHLSTEAPVYDSGSGKVDFGPPGRSSFQGQAPPRIR